MTDRIKGFCVALGEDIHFEDAEEIMNAVKLLKGVIGVEPSIADSEDWMNRTKIKQELREKLLKVLQ